MPGELSADEILGLLQLEPNATCGSVRVTFVSTLRFAAGGLPAPFTDARLLGSALYFLVTPDELAGKYSGVAKSCTPSRSRCNWRGRSETVHN